MENCTCYQNFKDFKIWEIKLYAQLARFKIQMCLGALATIGDFVRGNKDPSSAGWKNSFGERLMSKNIKRNDSSSTKMSLSIFKERLMCDSIVMKAKNSAKMWQLDNL